MTVPHEPTDPEDPAAGDGTTGDANTGGPDASMALLRRLWRGGAVLAVILAALVGLVGGSGTDGFAVFALVLALTAVVVGLVGTLGLIRDDLRQQPIARARILVVFASFFGSALLMAMVAGVGG